MAEADPEAVPISGAHGTGKWSVAAGVRLTLPIGEVAAEIVRWLAWV